MIRRLAHAYRAAFRAALDVLRPTQVEPEPALTPELRLAIALSRPIDDREPLGPAMTMAREAEARITFTRALRRYSPSVRGQA